MDLVIGVLRNCWLLLVEAAPFVISKHRRKTSCKCVTEESKVYSDMWFESGVGLQHGRHNFVDLDEFLITKKTPFGGRLLYFESSALPAEPGWRYLPEPCITVNS